MFVKLSVLCCYWDDSVIKWPIKSSRSSPNPETCVCDLSSRWLLWTSQSFSSWIKSAFIHQACSLHTKVRQLERLNMDVWRGTLFASASIVFTFARCGPLLLLSSLSRSLPLTCPHHLSLNLPGCTTFFFTFMTFLFASLRGHNI